MSNYIHLVFYSITYTFILYCRRWVKFSKFLLVITFITFNSQSFRIRTRRYWFDRLRHQANNKNWQRLYLRNISVISIKENFLATYNSKIAQHCLQRNYWMCQNLWRRKIKIVKIILCCTLFESVMLTHRKS